MSDVRGSVRTAIFAAIGEVNGQLPPDQQLDASESTILFGEGGMLDSLGLVNFIVAAEQQLEDQLGLSLTLADERAMAQESNPFETVGSLVDYATTLAGEGSSDR